MAGDVISILDINEQLQDQQTQDNVYPGDNSLRLWIKVILQIQLLLLDGLRKTI